MPTTIEQDLESLRDLLTDALPARAVRGFILGPSHAARWRHVLDLDLLPAPFATTLALGEGGFPVWNRTIFAQLLRQHEVGQPIFLIVPDFRFGNSIAAGPFVSGQFYNDHTHIRKEAITPRIDAMMYRHQVDSLAIWRTVFGRDLMIFDWTMLMNASGHHAEGRYMEDGEYQNPAYASWVQSDRPRLAALSWPPTVLEKQNDRLQRLVVDRSQHPSALGFLTQHGMMRGEAFPEALARAERVWGQWCDALAEAVRARATRPVVLHGSSVWLDMAQRQWSAAVLVDLAKAGLVLPGQPVPADAIHVRITDAVEHVLGEGTAECPHCVLWGAFARTLVARRHPENAHLAVQDLDALVAQDGLRWLDAALKAPRAAGFVDAGADLAPTFAGLAFVALSVLHAAAPA
ncbi:hypothetical protein [Falsirhodobacter sp. 20TX0035]|uniref:hypothetical protein n=1 Tax=Falsirhodobacter sp. 20TX0035 TaxID=3022019 RepID=UPI00232EBD00|nr:hypothetical protein [Falsirhodobacter sp. 20TX0035]MDB6452711.1 hypothetical protein [Falsirhodobacter sp. 20TX0035]